MQCLKCVELLLACFSKRLLSCAVAVCRNVQVLKCTLHKKYILGWMQVLVLLKCFVAVLFSKPEETLCSGLWQCQLSLWEPAKPVSDIHGHGHNTVEMATLKLRVEQAGLK